MIWLLTFLPRLCQKGREHLGLMDVTLLGEGLNRLRTLSYALHSCLISQGEKLSRRALEVEGTLDNRIVCDVYLPR